MDTKTRKSQLKELRDDLDKVLADFAKAHGLKDLHTGNASFSAGGSFTFKVEGIFSDGITPEAERYESARDLFNLPELVSDWKAGDGSIFKIVGINSTGTKVLIEKDNKRYEVKTELVSIKAG